jgi:hypothetical protein
MSAWQHKGVQGTMNRTTNMRWVGRGLTPQNLQLFCAAGEGWVTFGTLPDCDLVAAGVFFLLAEVAGLHLG